MVILDEADVMLNMGFREDIEIDSQGRAERTPDGVLLRHDAAPHPRSHREIFPRSAECED
ncbi:MAG: hypothetical protein QM813_20415 [Verrucomicrobiota bacterium]